MAALTSRIDVLIIPSSVVTAELKRDDIIQWIAHTAATAELTASVCTGAFLMAKSGLLRCQTITTHIGKPGTAFRSARRMDYDCQRQVS